MLPLLLTIASRTPLTGAGRRATAPAPCCTQIWKTHMAGAKTTQGWTGDAQKFVEVERK